MISADKHSFYYSDDYRIQNWENKTESMFLNFSQSEFLSFEFLVHKSNEKSDDYINHTVIVKSVYDIFS